MWSWNGKGKLAVKSAYRVLSQEDVDLQQFPSMLGQEQQHQPVLWKKLWRLKIPAKATHFVWRACNEVIPCMDHLQQQRVPFINNCVFCHNSNESPMHVFVNCPFALACWNLVELG